MKADPPSTIETTPVTLGPCEGGDGIASSAMNSLCDLAASHELGVK